MSVERVETLIVGGGQAGIAMSHQLSRGCPHLVLERHRIAERWRTERWDGIRFQFPNWSVRFPGFPLPHTDPDEFATAAEIVDFINAYADAVAAPVRCGVALTALRQRDDAAGFLAQTSEGLIEAANVVVATGPYQRPVIPPLLPRECGIFQVHASGYRNPDQLPGGAVLVVGGGLRCADRRRTDARGSPCLSVRQQTSTPAAPLSWTRSDVVVDRDGSAEPPG